MISIHGNKRRMLGQVFPGGPAFIENEQALKDDPDAETVRIGDVLLTLGDREVKGMSEQEIKEAFRGPADTRIQLGFVRHPVQTEPSAKHFSLGVLRRSSVRSKTEIFQGTPEKDDVGGDRGVRPGTKSSTRNGSRKSETGTNGASLDLGEGWEENMLSERLTADHFKVLAEENSVLKQSLVSMEEQLEEAERKTELSMKIIERVQQLEDKLLETEFNFSVLKQQGESDNNATHEKLQLTQMLQESRRLYTIAVDKCQHSEQELDRAQHTILLHAEREQMLRRKLAETKSALDESRSSETLLRTHLENAEVTIKKLTKLEGGEHAESMGGIISSRRGHDAVQMSDDDDYGIHGLTTPKQRERTHSRQALTENAKDARRKSKAEFSRSGRTSPPRKDGETSLISR